MPLRRFSVVGPPGWTREAGEAVEFRRASAPAARRSPPPRRPCPPGLQVLGALHAAGGRHQQRPRRRGVGRPALGGRVLCDVRRRDRLQFEHRLLRAAGSHLPRRRVRSTLLPEPARHDDGYHRNPARGRWGDALPGRHLARNGESPSPARLPSLRRPAWVTRRACPIGPETPVASVEHEAHRG
jgi:hypothetical protein